MCTAGTQAPETEAGGSRPSYGSANPAAPSLTLSDIFYIAMCAGILGVGLWLYMIFICIAGEAFKG